MASFKRVKKRREAAKTSISSSPISSDIQTMYAMKRCMSSSRKAPVNRSGPATEGHASGRMPDDAATTSDHLYSELLTHFDSAMHTFRAQQLRCCSPPEIRRRVRQQTCTFAYWQGHECSLHKFLFGDVKCLDVIVSSEVNTVLLTESIESGSGFDRIEDRVCGHIVDQVK
jgi:hypothetical protein